MDSKWIFPLCSRTPWKYNWHIWGWWNRPTWLNNVMYKWLMTNKDNDALWVGEGEGEGEREGRKAGMDHKVWVRVRWRTFGGWVKIRTFSAMTGVKVSKSLGAFCPPACYPFRHCHSPFPWHNPRARPCPLTNNFTNTICSPPPTTTQCSRLKSSMPFKRDLALSK